MSLPVDMDMLRASITRENIHSVPKDYGMLGDIDRCDVTPLYMACRVGHADAVKWLLQQGADPNRYFALSPLHVACNDECVRLLLAAGANPNATTKYGGHTVLCLLNNRCASFDGSVRIIRLLIKHGLRDIRENNVCSVSIGLFRAREQCRRVALLLLGLRRFRHSTVLNMNGIDVVRLIATHVWDTRVDDVWVEK